MKTLTIAPKNKTGAKLIVCFTLSWSKGSFFLILLILIISKGESPFDFGVNNGIAFLGKNLFEAIWADGTFLYLSPIFNISSAGIMPSFKLLIFIVRMKRLKLLLSTRNLMTKNTKNNTMRLIQVLTKNTVESKNRRNKAIINNIAFTLSFEILPIIKNNNIIKMAFETFNEIPT